MVRISMLLVVVVLSMSAVTALSQEPLPAIVAVDSGLAGDPRALMAAEAAGKLLSARYSVTPVVSAQRIWPELKPLEMCAPGVVEAVADRVSGLISGGGRLFFEEMDNTGALESLLEGAELYFASPCLRRYRPVLQKESCAGTALAVRLHLLAGRPEAAAKTAAALVSRCSDSDFCPDDLPPDVADFIATAAGDVASRTSSRQLKVSCAGTCRDVTVDGRPVECLDDACISAISPVGPGRHVVAVADPKGAGWLSSGFDWDGAPANLVVVPGTFPSSSGHLFVDGPDGGALNGISQVLGIAVIAVGQSPVSSDWQLVAADSVHSGAYPIAVISPSGDSVRVSAIKGEGLVLEERGPWPWPWVSGSLSAGFLVAGIVLNVYSERALNDAESGSNTMARYEGLRAGAIAGYVTAGAGVLTTILLAVLRPEPDQSVLVTPSPSGFTVSF